MIFFFFHFCFENGIAFSVEFMHVVCAERGYVRCTVMLTYFPARSAKATQNEKGSSHQRASERATTTTTTDNACFAHFIYVYLIKVCHSQCVLCMVCVCVCVWRALMSNMRKLLMLSVQGRSITINLI